MSYSPVYSAQFIVRAGSDPIAAFIVPEGFTAVVRQFTIFSSADIAECILTIQNDVDAPVVKTIYLTLTGLNTGSSKECRIVVPENGIIGIDEFDAGGSCHIYVGGYLIRNTVS